MYTEKYRTGLKRLWAAIVDGIVFMPVILVDQWIFKTADHKGAIFSWVTLITFLPVLYSIILHYKYGKTIGKWVAGVMVLDISETRKLCITQSIYRDIFQLVIAISGFIYYTYIFLRNDLSESVLSGYLSFSENLIFWWTLIELMSMLTNQKRRAVHDFIAKSVVVRQETIS